MLAARVSLIFVVSLFSTVWSRDCAMFGYEEEEDGAERFLDLGEMSVGVSDTFNISMDVLVNPESPKGVLFCIGTRGFNPSTYSTRSFRYFMLEYVPEAYNEVGKLQFSYRLVPDSSTLGTHTVSSLLPNEAYDVRDRSWHKVQARRFFEDDLEKWELKLDDLQNEVHPNPRMSQDFTNLPAFLGGRPGVVDYQNKFYGMIKNVAINGDRINLRNQDYRTEGVAIASCHVCRTVRFRDYLLGYCSA